MAYLYPGGKPTPGKRINPELESFKQELYETSDYLKTLKEHNETITDVNLWHETEIHNVVERVKEFALKISKFSKLESGKILGKMKYIDKKIQHLDVLYNFVNKMEEKHDSLRDRGVSASDRHGTFMTFMETKYNYLEAEKEFRDVLIDFCDYLSDTLNKTSSIISIRIKEEKEIIFK